MIAHELGHITGGHLTRRDQALRGAARHRGDRDARRAGGGGGRRAGGERRHRHRGGAGGAPQRAGLQPRRGGERRPGRPALPGGGGRRPAGDARRARPLPRPGRAALGRPRRSLRAEPPDVERAHGADRGPGGEAAARRGRRRTRTPTGTRRMVAKLDAFLGSPAQTLRKYPERDASEAAALARAIAWHRRPDPARADAAMQALLRRGRTTPTISTSRASSCWRAGTPRRRREVYRQAVALAPKEPLILGGLGRALLNMDDDAATAEARDVLARSVAADKANGGVLRDLALAEARLGNEGAAALATAERFTLEGEFRDAEPQRRARGGAPARGLAGVAAGAGYHYHGATRAEAKDAMRALLPLPRRRASWRWPPPCPRLAEDAAAVLALQRRRSARRCTPRSAPTSWQNPEVLQEMIQLLEQKQQAATAENDRDPGGDARQGDLRRRLLLGGRQPRGQLHRWSSSSTTSAASASGRSRTWSSSSSSDGDIRLIVKEMPILGPGSELAARAAVATLISRGPGEVRGAARAADGAGGRDHRREPRPGDHRRGPRPGGGARGDAGPRGRPPPRRDAGAGARSSPSPARRPSSSTTGWCADTCRWRRCGAWWTRCGPPTERGPAAISALPSPRRPEYTVGLTRNEGRRRRPLQ